MSACSIGLNRHHKIIMKKLRSLVAAISLAALSAAAADKEPSYQGRSFSDWAGQLDPHLMYVIGQEPPEILAIQSIGANAIPILLKWIAEKDPSDLEGKRTCFDATHGDRAGMVFAILGETATPAIQQLTKLAMTLRDRERYDRCISALASIGPDALPSFKTILTKGREGARWSALSYLPVFHSNAVVVLPEAIKCLAGKDEDLSWKAAGELSHLDVPGNILVPALTNALTSAVAPSRARIIRCIFWIDQPAYAAVPSLRTALTDRNYQVRWEATNALRRIAPKVIGSVLPR